MSKIVNSITAFIQTDFGGNVISQTALTVATTDIKKDMRGRGRQANFKIESNAVGGNFKVGTYHFDITPDGGR